MCIAGAYEIPEVLLYFNSKLMRGNRTTKVHSESFNAFASPNLAPIARVGTHIHVHWGSIRPPPNNETFRVHTAINANIACLRLFPGINKTTMGKVLSPPMAGVILQTYGSGNAPDNDVEFAAVLKEACQRGVVIVNCTQCVRGTVSAEYATGTMLLRAGVVPGFDMTVEAALAKLSVLLGQSLTPPEVRRLMQTNMRGELTPSDDHSRFSFKDSTFVRGVAQALRVTDPASITLIASSLSPVLLCSAASSGDVGELARLLNDGLQWGMTDHDKRTALHAAAAAGQLAVCEFLIKGGAPINAVDRWGRTPLHEAVLQENAALVALLVQNGARLDLSNAEFDLPALSCRAAAKGNLRLLRILSQCRCDLGCANVDGRTPMHLAASEGRLEVVLFLLEQHCSFLVQDRFGFTPMDDAIRQHHEVFLLTSRIFFPFYSVGLDLFFFFLACLFFLNFFFALLPYSVVSICCLAFSFSFPGLPLVCFALLCIHCCSPTFLTSHALRFVLD